VSGSLAGSVVALRPPGVVLLRPAEHAATPPAIFASLIGINTATAVRWTELAGGNWTTYAAA
jgi:hypothetical protein